MADITAHDNTQNSVNAGDSSTPVPEEPSMPDEPRAAVPSQAPPRGRRSIIPEVQVINDFDEEEAFGSVRERSRSPAQASPAPLITTPPSRSGTMAAFNRRARQTLNEPLPAASSDAVLPIYQHNPGTGFVVASTIGAHIPRPDRRTSMVPTPTPMDAGSEVGDAPFIPYKPVKIPEYVENALSSAGKICLHYLEAQVKNKLRIDKLSVIVDTFTKGSIPTTTPKFSCGTVSGANELAAKDLHTSTIHKGVKITNDFGVAKYMDVRKALRFHYHSMNAQVDLEVAKEHIRSLVALTSFSKFESNVKAAYVEQNDTLVSQYGFQVGECSNL